MQASGHLLILIVKTVAARQIVGYTRDSKFHVKLHLYEHCLRSN